VPLPAGIGVNLAHDCLYWLHTHDPNGIIHIESPYGLPHATLGSFFDIWRQPLTATQVWKYPVLPGKTLEVYVDGKRYASDPRAIPLQRHTTITIELDPPFSTPRPFDFGDQ
jgi:hypothetical protein